MTSMTTQSQQTAKAAFEHCEVAATTPVLSGRLSFWLQPASSVFKFDWKMRSMVGQGHGSLFVEATISAAVFGKADVRGSLAPCCFIISKFVCMGRFLESKPKAEGRSSH